MPRTVALALFLVLCTIAASAQPSGYPAPYGITGATYSAQFTASTTIDAPQAKKVTVIFGVVVWATSSNGIEYSINVADMSYSGDVDALASLTAVQVFDAVSAAAASGGIANGYSPAVTCPTTGSTGVTLASCVTRSAEGFTASGSATVRRGYGYCGAAVAATGVTGGASCGSGAEVTTVLLGID
jgi:hypothetical protein